MRKIQKIQIWFIRVTSIQHRPAKPSPNLIAGGSVELLKFSVQMGQMHMQIQMQIHSPESQAYAESSRVLLIQIGQKKRTFKD